MGKQEGYHKEVMFELRLENQQARQSRSEGAEDARQWKGRKILKTERVCCILVHTECEGTECRGWRWVE